MQRGLIKAILEVASATAPAVAEKVIAFTSKKKTDVKAKPKGSRKEQPLGDKELAALVEAAGILTQAKETIEAALAKVREEIEALEPELGTYKGLYGKVTAFERDQIEITDPVTLARTVGLERFLGAVTIRPTKKVLDVATGRKARSLVKVEKVRSLRIGKV